MKKRPVTTLFMLSSVDGKITTGSNDSLDFDQDFPNIKGLCEGLYQYYDIQETTDLWSLNSGRVQQKMGVNEKPLPDHHWDVSFVLLDNSHLNEHGIEYFCALSKEFVLVTSNREHPAFSVKADNLHILFYEELRLEEMLCNLYEKFGCEHLTIQSGAELNGAFLREKLFDFIDIVVAPVLVGGKDTAPLIGGKSLVSSDELEKLGVLELLGASVLKNSYLRLKYKVIG